MNEQKSNHKASTSSNATMMSTMTTGAISLAGQPKRRMAQNYLLIWIDASIDESDKDCQDILTQLRTVVYDINVFTQLDQAIDFLTELEKIKAFLIVGDTFGQQIIPLIHNISQLDAIYIFCDNQSPHEQWTEQWGKVKGVHTKIKTICEALQLAVKNCNQDSIAMSFAKVNETSSSQNLDQLEPTFMYTQIFKEILLDMKYNQQSIKKFTAHCRQNDCGALNNIDQFENEYQS